MFRSSMLSDLARRVLPCLAVLAFLAPVALAGPQPGIRATDAPETSIDLLDHVRTQRSVSISPEG